MMSEDIRHGRYWLLASQIAVVAPQWDWLPPWLLLLALTACLWRLPAVEIRVRPPNAWVRALVLLVGGVGLWQTYGTIFGSQAGSAFLVLCVALKLLEMHNRRDCYIVVILSFFVLATNFLFEQSLIWAIYIAGALGLIIAALLVMHQPADVSGWRTLRKAMVFLGQAIPLMVILFVFFPRLPPLWSLQLSQGTGRTGIAESISPGDIASLSRSDELAFRVEFEGATPERSELYWRGLVFSQFDGRTWRREPQSSNPQQAYWAESGESRDWVDDTFVNRKGSLLYRVILEPTDRHWLFALDVPQPQARGVGLTREYTLISGEPVFARKTYDVRSYPLVARDRYLPDWLREKNLTLPEEGNARSRAMAQSWRQQSPDDVVYINRVLAWYTKTGFAYTLEPPLLGENRIDDFLFKARQGFCEHYASSFVFLMRAAGIPARVVGGYQGGEPSAYGDYWLVRQQDAHAWAEVWEEGLGWVAVDPTAAVAPDRVQRGVTSVAQRPEYWGQAGDGGFRFGNYPAFRAMRQWVDYMNYRWYKDVLGYDSDSQDGLMQRLLGDADYLKRTVLMVVSFVGVLAVMVLWMLWRQPRRQESPIDRHYRRYCERMGKAGFPRQAGEPALAYAERLAASQPHLAEGARQVASLYVHLSYKPNAAKDALLLRRFRRSARMATLRA